MKNGRSEIQWAPRVPKWKIRRLYESEAKGLLDEELLVDVGLTLLLRCQDILTIKEAKHGRVKCPRCARGRQNTIIERAFRKSGGDVREEVLACPQCSWQITWGEYALSFKRKQLNSGGATEAFEAYVKNYHGARTVREKMLVIDRLIHEFHYSLRQQPDLPTRPVGVNLIQGKVGDVVQFLDDLTYGDTTPKEMKGAQAKWRSEMGATYWRDLVPGRGEAGEDGSENQ